MSHSRLVGFSDGVLAVAITLLVLDLHVEPGNGTDLLTQLAQAWPSFAAYVVSFLVIGVIWVNHHSILQLTGSIDRPLLFWNLLLLMFVTAIPFTTATLAASLADGSPTDIRVATILYGGGMTGMAVAFTALYARITDILTRAGAMEPRTRRASIVRFGAGTILYPLITLIGLLYAPAMLCGLAALSIYYLFNQTGTPAIEPEPPAPTR